MGDATTIRSPRLPIKPRESTDACEAGSKLSIANTLPAPSSRWNTATCVPLTSAHTPVFGTMSCSSHTGTQDSLTRSLFMLGSSMHASCSFDHHRDGDAPRLPFFRRGRPDLAAFLDEGDVRVALVAVDEMAEALAGLGIGDRLLPLAFVGIDHELHLRFEIGGNAELVVHHHVDEIREPAFQVLAPDTRAL